MAPKSQFEQIQENAMRSYRVFAGLLAVALAFATGCRENPIVPDGNKLPFANAGFDLQVDYAGTPVTVMLDGTMSTDDGVIDRYLWFSATPLSLGDEDAGIPPGMGALSYTTSMANNNSVTVTGGGRFVPVGQRADWPDDVAQPMVTLDRGLYTFALWVRDDVGVVSEPDTVIVRVGADPVQECKDGTIDLVADPCKECVCNLDDTCRATVVESSCGEACWGLIQCIGAMCPDYAMMIAQMPPDTSCVTMNCSAFLGDLSILPMARIAGACARMCPDACRAMP